jgi:hypothetical protein
LIFENDLIVKIKLTGTIRILGESSGAERRIRKKRQLVVSMEELPALANYWIVPVGNA